MAEARQGRPTPADVVDGVEVIWPSQERRRTHRSQAARDLLPYAVLRRGAHRLQGRVADTSARGAGLVLKREQGPALRQLLEDPAGGALAVVFEAAGSTLELAVPCRVGAVRPYLGFIRLSLRFEVTDAGHETLPPQLRPVVSRRGPVRVAPPRETPVEIVLHPKGHSQGFTGVALDLSVAGAGVAVVGEQASLQLATAPVELSLRFNLRQPLLTVPGQVVWTRAEGRRPPQFTGPGACSVLGIQFLPPQEGEDALRKPLEHYVVERHLAGLRSRAT